MRIDGAGLRRPLRPVDGGGEGVAERTGELDALRDGLRVNHGGDLSGKRKTGPEQSHLHAVVPRRASTHAREGAA